MSFSECKFVWKNGQLLPWEQATFHVSCHGLHYGTGVFEGIRSYKTPDGPAVFRLPEHIDRFFASATVYGMRLPYSKNELSDAVLRVIAANELDECYVRPIAFYGSRSLGIDPRPCPVEVVILAWPWNLYLGGEGQLTGVSTTISKWSKFDSNAIPAIAKASGQYVNSVLATQDAVARGFDEAILLDGEFVAEGPGENLFLVKNGKLFTNDQRSPVLMGITRETILQLASDLRLETWIGPLRLQDLLEADEAFFTGTAVEVTPIRSVDHKPIGNVSKGPITAILQRIYLDVTRGRNSRYRSWLSLIPEIVRSAK